MNILPDMIPDLLLALTAAIIFGIVPGWFWAVCLCGTRTDAVERIAFSAALSATLIPAVTLPVLNLLSLRITLAITIVSALVVLISGLAAYLYFGTQQQDEETIKPPPTLSAPTLALISLALGLVLWASLSEQNIYLLVALGLVTMAALAFGLGDRRSTSENPDSEEPGLAGRVVRSMLVVVVLAFVLVRGYLGVVLHDWPYLRGGDQFNHAVMANQMLLEGNFDQYLFYPPGFAVMTAGISNLSGLDPIKLYPAFAPALLLLPAVACYTLAKRLWGWECGVAAMALAGLIHSGTYANISQARYPNLVSAQFLLVLAVAALIMLYRSPAPRSILLFGLLGSSVVLYHSVAMLYAVLIFALVSFLILPYLLIRHRRTGVALLISMALLGLFAVAFAWDIYNLPNLVGGLVTGSGTGSGGEVISIVIGTQPTLELSGLPERVSPPVFWLGLMGLLLTLLWRWSSVSESRLAEKSTLALWCLVLFVGSRTVQSGFPQRFERDLGMPLAILGALVFVVVLRSVVSNAPAITRRSGTVPALVFAILAASISLSLIGVWSARAMELSAKTSTDGILTKDIAEAGEWLREHESGGNIVTSPTFGNITNRGMLALSAHDRLQSFTEKRTKTPRSLPPAGRSEIEDAAWILQNPSGERSAEIIENYSIRYAVLSKQYPGSNPRAFAADGNHYRIAFQNDTIVIFAPREKNSS